MADDRTAGQVIDARYELRAPLGRGGMGVVWRAYDSLLGREVAVKEVRFPAIVGTAGRAALCDRLGEDARRVAVMEHPAVVRVLDVVDEDGRPYVVTELVEAPTLAERVSAGGPMSPEQVAAIGIDVLDALAAAHAQGLVHRFVQPAKVLLPPEGGARLCDFGLAALIGDPLVTATGAIGTVSYMAPEQDGRPLGDAATDVWSVGATLFYAAEGRPPFDAGSAKATLAAIAGSPPRPLLRAGGLRPILDDVLVKDPAARPDVASFRRRLAGLRGPNAEPGLRGPNAEPGLRTGPEPEIFAVEQIVEPGGGSAWYERETLADPAEPEADPAEPEADPVEPEAEPVVEDEDGDGGVWSVGVAFGPDTADDPDLDPDLDPDPEGPEPEPPPLPPAVALGRMFSPDVERPLPPYEDAVPPDEPPPRALWPLARPWRPGAAFLAGLIIALLVFLVLTGTRFLTGRGDRVARSQAATVNWVTYADPGAGFTLDHPSTWTINRNENLVDFRDPASSAALRVAVQAPRGTPQQVWTDLEQRFLAEHPSYRRVRLEPTVKDGLEAAVWEFTWTDAAGTDLHNSDLALNSGGRAFALNFQTRADEWDALNSLFDRFTSSFEPSA